MLTEDQFGRLAWFDPTTKANLKSGLGAVEDISAAGTINLGCYETKIAVSGTMAFTLPDGTVEGQKKRVSCESAASTPKATLTVTTPDTTSGYVCASSFIFDTAGQSVEFVWTGAKWRATDVRRAGTSGADGVVVGTTVLTGRNLWTTYLLSVTGTVTSSTTQGLPNGSVPGERIFIGVTTAATTPAGELDGAFTVLGAAKTKITAIDATTEQLCLEWDGVGWAVMASTLTAGHPTFA